MYRIPILLLAAGASTRMGEKDKLLEPVSANLVLLNERIKVARRTGQQVYVALPPPARAPARWAAIELRENVTLVEIPAPHLGMSASIVGLINALSTRIDGDIDGAMILPADMPDLSASDLKKVLEAFTPGRVVRGASNGKAGHPVLFPASWFSQLTGLSGDTGARDLLRDTNALLVSLPEGHAFIDLDTPADWAKWRAASAPR